MGLFTVQKTEAKVIIIEQLKDEVIADGTISAEADTVRIVNDASTEYYFEFDDTAYDNNGALSGAADTALQAVIDAHVPAGNPPTEPPLNGLRVKAGRVAAGSFSGSPRTASVSFNTPYETYETYVVTFSVRASNQNTHYIPTVYSYSNTGFTVSLGTGSTSNLIEVHWIAVAEGEDA